MTAMQDIILQEAETFPLGVQRYAIEDGEIAVVISTGDMSYHAIDEWVSVMAETIQMRADTLRPAFLLTMASVGEHGFSRYAQKRLEDIQNGVADDYPVYFAMVYPPGIISQFVSVFLNSMTRRSTKQVRATMFTDHDQAVNWLNQMRARHDPSLIERAV